MKETPTAEIDKLADSAPLHESQPAAGKLLLEAWQENSAPARPASKPDYPFPMPAPKPKPGPIRPEDFMPPLQILDNGKSLLEWIEDLNRQEKTKPEPKKNRIAETEKNELEAPHTQENSPRARRHER